MSNCDIKTVTYKTNENWFILSIFRIVKRKAVENNQLIFHFPNERIQDIKSGTFIFLAESNTSFPDNRVLMYEPLTVVALDVYVESLSRLLSPLTMTF